MLQLATRENLREAKFDFPLLARPVGCSFTCSNSSIVASEDAGAQKLKFTHSLELRP